MAAGAAPITTEDLPAPQPQAPPPPPVQPAGGIQIAVTGSQPIGPTLGLPPPPPNALALPPPQTYASVISGHEGTGQNPRSSAFGTGQFIRDTWLSFAKANPDMFQGMDEAQILAKRSDPAYGTKATNWLAQQNANELERQGIHATGQSLGIAHYLGAQPTVGVMGANDNEPVSKFVNQAALDANPELRTMTVGQMKTRYANVPNPDFLGGGTAATTDVAQQAATPQKNPLAINMPDPAAGMANMKQMMTMAMLQSMLPKGMGFQQVDYHPMKAYEIGKSAVPGVNWGGLGGPGARVVMGSAQPALSPMGLPEYLGGGRRRRPEG